MTAQPAEPQPASTELAALAVATRPDWATINVAGIIANARVAGMTWPQVLLGLVRLMTDPRAVPAELVPDWRDPVAAAHRSGADPADHATELAQAREAMAAAAAKRRATDRQVAERQRPTFDASGGAS